MNNSVPSEIIAQLKPDFTHHMDEKRLEELLANANAAFAAYGKRLETALADGRLIQERDELFSKMEKVIRHLLIFQQHSAAYACALKYAEARQQYAIN